MTEPAFELGWVAIPKGKYDSDLLVTVMISPATALEDASSTVASIFNKKYGSWPERLQDPEQLTGLSFDFLTNNATETVTVASNQASLRDAIARAKKVPWATLFTPDMLIRNQVATEIPSLAPPQFGLTPHLSNVGLADAAVRSFQAREGIAKGPAKEDLISRLVALHDKSRSAASAWGQLGRSPDELTPSDVARSTDGFVRHRISLVADPVQRQLLEDYCSYWESQVSQRSKPRIRSAPPERPSFMDIYSHFDRQLLPTLGLALDLIIPGGKLPSESCSIRVTPQGALGAVSTYQSVAVDSAAFFPALEGSDRSIDATGIVNLPGYFKLDTHDAISTLHALRNYVLRTVAKQKEGRSAVSASYPDDSGSLRARGVGIALNNLQTKTSYELRLVRHARRNEALSSRTGLANRDLPMHLDDLIMGYHLDVMSSATKKWRSITARDTYFDNFKIKSGDLEGVPIPSKTRSEVVIRRDIKQTLAENATHEVAREVCRWEGWTLGALSPDAVDETMNNPGLPAEAMALKASHTAAARSLPKLRYGRNYSFGARAVLIDGSSLQDTDSASKLYSGKNTLTTMLPNWEVASAPSILLTAPLNRDDWPLETTTRIVARTAKDSTIPDVDSPLRFIVPPRISLRDAIANGCFDSGLTPRDGAFSFAQLTCNGSFPPVKAVVDPACDTSFDAAAPDGILRERPTGWPDPIYPYYPDATVSYVLVRLGRIDPVIGFIPIVDSLGRPMQFQHPIFTDAGWPHVAPLGIRINPVAIDASVNLKTVLNQAGPKWGTVLVVDVPEGTAVIARCCSIPNIADIRNSGYYQILVQSGIETPELIESEITRGVVDLMTPYADLTLVHASELPVRQPKILWITSPDLAGASTQWVPALNRAVNSTFQDLTVRIEVHAASSSQATLVANWTDVIDDKQGSVFPRQIPQVVRLPSEPINYSPIGGPLENQPVDQTFVLRQQFGDTKTREVKYVVQVDSRFLKDFNYPAKHIPAVLTSETRIVRILSTTAPPPPNLRYIVPLISFDPPVQDGLNIKHARRSGLRFWMERPWFDTGDNEMLALIFATNKVADAGFNALSGSMRSKITLWGRAPVWDTPLARQVPRHDDFFFGYEVEGVSSFSFKLNSGESVELGTIPAVADERSNGYYFDLPVIRGDSFLPFIRFAIARYQEHSLPSLCLSNIVLLDFIQILPDRFLTLVRHRLSPTQLQVTVTGAAPITPVPPNLTRLKTVITVSVEIEVTTETGDADSHWRTAFLGDQPCQYILAPAKAEGNLIIFTSSDVRCPLFGGRQRLLVRETILPAYADDNSAFEESPIDEDVGIHTHIYLDTIDLSVSDDSVTI